jgi:hypothetical protein
MNKLAVLTLLLLGTLASASAQSGVTSKRLNFAYTHGNPDYVDLSSLGGNVFAAGIDNQMVKARNLKSFAVNFRGWRLMDEYIVDPEFFWELDPISLKGKIRTVNYEKISKYPSLAKRYKAIKPVGVNYIVCVDLDSIAEFESGPAARWVNHQVCFRAQSYQMFWGASRSGRAASYPGALLGWKEGISTASLASRFLASDNSDVNRLKNIVSKFRSVAKYSGSPTNTWLDIRWPDDAIDKIYDDFEEYEKEGKDLEKEYKEAKEEPKVAKRTQPLAADDEMAQPFEDMPKTAKTFYEGAPSSRVGLVTPNGKKVFTSNEHSIGTQLDEKGSIFMFGHRDRSVPNYIHLINAGGKRMKIDGHSAVMDVEKRADGLLDIYVDNGGAEVFKTDKCYSELKTTMAEPLFARLKARDAEPLKPLPPGNPNAVYFAFSEYHYVYKTVLHYVADSKLKVVSKAQGYAVARTEKRRPERCSRTFEGR